MYFQDFSQIQLGEYSLNPALSYDYVYLESSPWIQPCPMTMQTLSVQPLIQPCPMTMYYLEYSPVLWLCTSWSILLSYDYVLPGVFSCPMTMYYLEYSPWNPGRTVTIHFSTCISSCNRQNSILVKFSELGFQVASHPYSISVMNISFLYTL